MYTQRGQSTPAAADLLEGLPHLLAPEGINERVYNRVAHNEDQIHVEVGHETDTIRVPRAGDHEDEVQEKGAQHTTNTPSRIVMVMAPFIFAACQIGTLPGRAAMRFMCSRARRNMWT